MIGNLVHYNCGESKAIGVVTDMFRYEATAAGGPDHLRGRLPEEFWPRDWYTKKWYNAQWFKVISKI